MPVNVKNWTMNLILILTSVAIGLMAVESFLAWDNRRPNARLVDVTLNGTKYKLPETLEAINQPKGAVLIVGDSFTAGSACIDEKNYPSAFTKAARQSKSDLHAINMGVSGTNPMAYALRVSDYFAEKGPTSGVILTLYANDVEIGCLECRHFNQWSQFASLTSADGEALEKLCAPCLRAKSQKVARDVAGHVSAIRRLNWWLSDHSLTYRVLREAGAMAGVGSGWLRVDWGRGVYLEHWSNQDGIYFKYVQGSIGFAKQEADRHRLPMMVVIYPDPVNITQSNEFVGIYDDASKALAGATGVPVYSGYEAFLGNPLAEKNMTFSLSDKHPNCKAHSIFGDWVFEQWTGVQKAHRQ